MNHLKVARFPDLIKYFPDFLHYFPDFSQRFPDFSLTKFSIRKCKRCGSLNPRLYIYHLNLLFRYVQGWMDQNINIAVR